MNKTLPALPGKAPALPPGAFEIGYTAHDGAQHRVPLANAAVVRFADTQPTRRIRTRRTRYVADIPTTGGPLASVQCGWA